MNDKKISIQILIIVSVCIIYLLLSFFYYYIEKYLNGLIFIALTLLLTITFITIIIYTIKGLINIYLNKQNLNIKFVLPTIIALITLAYTFFSPWRLDCENLESDVKMRACYEGTQNQSFIRFREDSSFEIHSTGVFFANYWYWGKWKKCNDTLFLKFDTEKNMFLDDTVIIHNDYLIPIGHLQIVDSLKLYHKYYYLGYCKGLN